jgi:hypothetical protein
VRLEGITDISNPSCGDNPCTWFDNVYVGDPCLTFLKCADPSNLLVTGATQGAGAMTGQAVGQEIGGFFGGLGTGFGQNPGGSSLLLIGGAVALILALSLLRR